MKLNTIIDDQRNYEGNTFNFVVNIVPAEDQVRLTSRVWLTR